MGTKKSNWKRVALVFIAVITALSGWGYVWLRGIPFKVTDPADPRFDPKRFCFCDYATAADEDLREVLAVLFPVGTTQNDVEKVLVDAGQARAHQNKNHANLVTYREPWRLHWNVPPMHAFTYDDKRRVLNIQPYGGPKLFSDQPNFLELEERK